MSKNPFLNAFAAFAYIILIVSVMTWGTKMVHGPDTFMAPIVVISLFTLSAAVMGYIFCYQPVQLYFDGKKKAAVNLFLHTVAVFGAITAIILAVFFFRIIK
jgi:hypothetical protein